MEEQVLEDSVKHNTDREEIDVEREVKIQNSLHDAKDSFNTDSIVAITVLECTYRSSGGVKYNGERYDLNKRPGLTSYIGRGDTAYVPVFVLDYNGVYKTFTNGVYKSKENANEFVRELEEYKNSFRFKINSDSSILFNSSGNKFYEKLKSIDFIDSYRGIDSFILLTVPFGVSLFLYGLTMIALDSAGPLADPVSVFLTCFVSTIAMGPTIMQQAIDRINNKFNKYNIIDIDVQDIIESNILDKENTDYTVVEADININKDGLTVTSDELDCKWEYDRQDNELIDEAGVKLLNSVPVQNGSCVLAVKNKGYSDNQFVSEDGNWWIDLENST